MVPRWRGTARPPSPFLGPLSVHRLLQVYFSVLTFLQTDDADAVAHAMPPKCPIRQEPYADWAPPRRCPGPSAGCDEPGAATGVAACDESVSRCQRGRPGLPTTREGRVARPTSSLPLDRLGLSPLSLPSAPCPSIHPPFPLCTAHPPPSTAPERVKGAGHSPWRPHHARYGTQLTEGVE